MVAEHFCIKRDKLAGKKKKLIRYNQSYVYYKSVAAGAINLLGGAYKLSHPAVTAPLIPGGFQVNRDEKPENGSYIVGEV